MRVGPRRIGHQEQLYLACFACKLIASGFVCTAHHLLPSPSLFQPSPAEMVCVHWWVGYFVTVCSALKLCVYLNVRLSKLVFYVSVCAAWPHSHNTGMCVQHDQGHNTGMCVQCDYSLSIPSFCATIRVYVTVCLW